MLQNSSLHTHIYISIDRTVGWTLIAKSLSLFSFIHHLLEVSRSVAEMGSFGMLSRRTLGTDTPVMTQVSTSYSRIDSYLFGFGYCEKQCVGFCGADSEINGGIDKPHVSCSGSFPPLSLQLFFLFASRNTLGFVSAFIFVWMN